MIMKMYAIKDVKVAFRTPFFARSDGEACRMFEMNLKANDDIKPFAADYELYKIGDFDDENGSFAFLAVEYLMSGKDVNIE